MPYMYECMELPLLEDFRTKKFPRELHAAARDDGGNVGGCGSWEAC